MGLQGSKLLLVGATAAQILELTQAAPAAAEAVSASVAAAASGSTTWCELTEHRKVINRGKPEDAALAYRPGQVCVCVCVGGGSSH